MIQSSKRRKKTTYSGFTNRRNTFITLFWPKKRRSREFKLHLPNILQYARRHYIKKVILFLDHVPCHKTKKVRRFMWKHPVLKAKFLPKRAPNLILVERLINKPFKSAVCTNGRDIASTMWLEKRTYS